MIGDIDEDAAECDASISEHLPELGTTEARIIAFLRDDEYVAVQEAVIYLETVESNLRIEAIANFRDVLDHLVRASKSSEAVEAENHLTEARDHLGRALTDPYQEAISDKFRLLGQRAKWHYIRYGLFPDVLTERQFLERLEDVRKRMIKVRILKGDLYRIPESCNELKEIYDALLKIENDIRPSKRSNAFRIARLLVGSILAGSIGAVIGIVLTR